MKKQKLFDKNFKEILVFQIFSILGGLIAGTFLAIYTDKIFLIPGMLILLPGLLEMRGNISGSFSSRISSGLFLKVIKPYDIKTKVIKGNLISSLILTITVSAILGIFATFFTYLIFKEFVPLVFYLAVISGVIGNIIEIPITLFLTYFLFKKGHDPNNIMGPLVTSIGDILSVISILIAITII